MAEPVVTLRRGRWAAAVCLLLGVAASCGARESQKTEILWDRYGVPHIFAADDESLFYAFGWAQAASHGDLLLQLYGESRGRAAEYWGEEHLESDRWVRKMDVPERARKWHQAQTPSFRSNLDAFARGINDYAREKASLIDQDLRIVLPVDAIDVLAHTQRVIHFSFVAGPGEVDRTARSWAGKGSNTWAIAPERSATGNAMLLANPHLPWSGFMRFYEAHLRVDETNLYGTTLVGFPGLGIAFNDYLGWSHTVNTHDGADLYELSLTEGGYRWNGGARPFEEKEQTLKVKLPDGGFREEKLVIKHSIHGPVVAEEKGKALALRVAGLDRPGMLEQWWEMGRAQNLAEFETALRRLEIPMFTVMYADREGHILHLFNANVPVRPDGDWMWEGLVRGDTDDSLWTRIHPYGDLPRVLDPPTGWLQNANDAPWTTTFPPVLDRKKFPSYMARGSMNIRAQRSARMLAEDEEITFEELIEYKHSTRMELADRILDDLFAAVERHGGTEARRAATVLERWDREADADSRGGVLFQEFVREAERRFQNDMFATPWNEDSPRTTPDGLANPSVAVAALETAAQRIEMEFGSLDVAWGDVHRLRIGHMDLPANGGPGGLGVFRVTGFRPEDDKRYRAVAGDSFVAVVEFGNPIRATVLLGYGNSSQPGSPHQTDQLEFYARKQLRPAWRTREEILANLESRKEF